MDAVFLCLIWAVVSREFFKLGVAQGRAEGYLCASRERDDYRVH